jgi:hypothetical protein
MRAAVGSARNVGSIRHDIRVQEEQVEARQPQPAQTVFDRAPRDAFDLVGGRVTEIAFTGDPHAFWEPAAKCLAHHFLCFAVAIARREIEEINSGSDRVMYGRDAFVEARRPPQLPSPPPPKVSDDTGHKRPKTCVFILASYLADRTAATSTGVSR